MPALLLVLTGADRRTLDDGTPHPTGFWAEELVSPMRVFRDAGVDVTIATPGGVRPTVDEDSLRADVVGGEQQAADLRGELDALAEQLAAPTSLADVAPADYDGVFISGGRSPMEDLADSPELGRLLVTMLDDDRVIASASHGPAALRSAERDDGTWAFAGRDLSGFTNEGAGQNPASSTDFAQKTVERLDARAHWLHVVPYEGGWTFKHERGEPEGRFRTQKQAIEAAKQHGSEHGDWELVIHGRSGRIRDAVGIH